MLKSRSEIIFYLNGLKHVVPGDQAHVMLADYLRYELGLIGTKVVCAEGDCGACSILRLEPHAHRQPFFEPINSCISPLIILDGSILVTVDALKNNQQLHPVQQSMMECHGSQCGFCTPGFVMALTGLVEKKKCSAQTSLTAQDVRNATTGNLCRCTGYEPIIQAGIKIKLEECESLYGRFVNQVMLDDLAKIFRIPFLSQTAEKTFYAPTTIEDACHFLSSQPEAKIIASSTDLGVMYNKRKSSLPKLISLHLIPKLYEIDSSPYQFKIGSKVSIERFRQTIKHIIPELAHYLDIFASPQIKNIATVIGNIANASPIGDLPPALMTLKSSVHIASTQGEKVIPLEDFFVAYRKTQLQAGEFITALSFHIPETTSNYRLYKNSNRKDLDISAVNLAFHLKWEDDQKSRIKEAYIAGGGLGPTPLRFPQTEKLLASAPFSKTLILKAGEQLQKEFKPISDLRASAAYRRLVVDKLFHRFFNELHHPELQA